MAPLSGTYLACQLSISPIIISRVFVELSLSRGAHERVIVTVQSSDPNNRNTVCWLTACWGYGREYLSTRLSLVVYLLKDLDYSVL